MGCANRHVEESTLEKAFIMAWNGILENREYFLRKWEEQMQSENLLEVYRAKDFWELTKEAGLAEKIDTDFMLRVLACIKVSGDGQLLVLFLDGTEIECIGTER